jgi:ubiquinone/menaquinone biosynthesis C-methylase UbiE
MAQYEGEQEQWPDSSGPYMTEGEDLEAQGLIQQQKHLSDLMGGILPPLLEPSWGSRVLEIGWCIGELIHEMASRCPSLHITGIDRNASVVEQAQTLVRGLSNAIVFVQDIHQLDEKVFSSASFDFIHLHFLVGDVTLEQFPPLMHSLARFCRPGGLLVWTEAELPITTSLACQHLCSLVQRGLQARDHVFSHGNSLGITARMNRWLNDAGYRITQSKAYAIDISTGSKGNEAFVTQVGVSGEQVRSFLLEAGVTTSTEFEDIFLQMQQEIQEEQFCGLLYLRTLVGMRS